MRHDANDKQSVRTRLRHRRSHRDPAEQATAEHGLCATTLGVPEIGRARVVACYVAIHGEPGTVMLLDELRSRGVQVLLPILRPSGELDWASYEGAAALIAGPRGTRSPSGPSLGLEAIGIADAVLVPGVAVDSTGVRLGRGGGSYDRALAQVPPGVFTAILLYDDEVVNVLPHEAHDRRVSAAITPTRVVRFRPPETASAPG